MTLSTPTRTQSSSTRPMKTPLTAAEQSDASTVETQLQGIEDLDYESSNSESSPGCVDPLACECCSLPLHTRPGATFCAGFVKVLSAVVLTANVLTLFVALNTVSIEGNDWVLFLVGFVWVGTVLFVIITTVASRGASAFVEGDVERGQGAYGRVSEKDEESS